MRIAKKIISSALIFLLIILVLIFLAVILGRTINYFKTKISTENGIQSSEYVSVGGIEQYIQIRGQDKDNPVILFLHGGPAAPSAFYSYYWQTNLEKDYTIVNWDQRGCGRTYYKNASTAVSPTMDRMLSDVDELITYLTNRFAQDKVIIIGHSWGTVLGTEYIVQHPEKVFEYIGIGQVVNAMETEKISADEAIRIASERNDVISANKIKAAYDTFTENEYSFQNLMSLRNITAPHLPSGENLSTVEQTWMGLSSPYMNINDIRWYLMPNVDFDKYADLNDKLFSYLHANGGVNFYDKHMNFEVPMNYISGDCDWVTPYTLVQDYYGKISAPKKNMILIKNTGHNPFLDNPNEFCDAIIKVLGNTD